MIKREALNELGMMEITPFLEKSIREIEAELTTLSIEELEAREADLMVDMDEYQAYIQTVEYDLAEGIEDATKEEIAQYIIEFIDRQELQWEYVEGVLALVNLWKDTTKTTITYGAYDSTLRILGITKYKGYEDWMKIGKITRYLDSTHIGYVKDGSYLSYLSQIHNTILQNLQKDEEPVKEQVEE